MNKYFSFNKKITFILLTLFTFSFISCVRDGSWYLKTQFKDVTIGNDGYATVSFKLTNKTNKSIQLDSIETSFGPYEQKKKIYYHGKNLSPNQSISAQGKSTWSYFAVLNNMVIRQGKSEVFRVLAWGKVEEKEFLLVEQTRFEY